MSRSEQTSGIILVTVSAVVFSTAGLFVKLVEAGSWEVIFWRGIFAIGFSMIYITWRRGIQREFFRMGRSGIAVAIVGAMGTAAFVPAFKMTTIANVTLIYAAAPVIASLLAWRFAGERLRLPVILTIVMAFGGVMIIVSGSLGSLHLNGDLLAMFMTAMMAMLIVIYRLYPETPAAGPVVLSALLLLVPAILFGNPQQVALNEIAVLAAFGLIFSVAAITLGEGARRISAAQTALLSALETPLAPLLAWLVLAEDPGLRTITGGSIVFGAVILAQVFSRQAKTS